MRDPLPHLPRSPVRQAPPEAEARAHVALRSKVPTSDAELATQCLLDTAARASTATFLYPLIWLSVCLVTRASATWPTLVWGNLIGLIALSLIRHRFNLRLPSMLHRHPARAGRIFNLLALAAATYWGTLTALLMAMAPMQALSWMTLAVTLSMATGGAILLGFNPRLRYTYPAALMAPVVVAQLMQPTTEHLLMLAMEALFAVFLCRASGMIHADYWNGRHAQRLAEEQARELELASLTDGLTQVPNRIHFDRLISHEWARQCRRGGHMTVLLVDLDHFKNINDSFGHPFGDTCLVQVAAALRTQCSRSTDFVARYGGEEFVVLLPETDQAGAIVVAQNMLDAVRALSLDADGLSVKVTCSVGLATTRPRHGQGPHTLVQRADVALYEAKRRGRNRIELAEPDITAG